MQMLIPLHPSLPLKEHRRQVKARAPSPPPLKGGRGAHFFKGGNGTESGLLTLILAPMPSRREGQETGDL